MLVLPVSVSINLDFADEVKSTPLPRQLPAVTVVGESAELQYCDLEVAIAQLNDQWATGIVMALILEGKR